MLKSLFTLVVIYVCIDIDVIENRAELQRKDYLVKAEKRGNFLQHIRLTIYRGHPHFIALLGDHLLVNTSIASTSSMPFKSKYMVCSTFPKAWMNR